MKRNPSDVFEAAKPDIGTDAVMWDAAAEQFVRVTISAVGSILARADLEPAERRATLRRLMATRATLQEQRAMGDLLRRLNLVAGSPGVLHPAEQAATVRLLTARFVSAFGSPDVAAFVEHMEVGIRAFLVLAWSVALVRAAPEQALPQLEALDADHPYMPPCGLEAAPITFDANSVLAEIDADDHDSSGAAVRPMGWKS